MSKTEKDPEVASHGVAAEHARLQVPQVTWYRHAGLRSLYLRMPILMLCATINGYDGSLLNGLQTIQPWRTYFNDPSGSTLGLFTAIVNIGGFSALFFSVPTVNEGMFIGGRFLVGFGSNISIGAGPLLILELAYPQHRARLTVMYNTLWGTEAMKILVKYHANGDESDAFVHAEFAEIQETIRLEKESNQTTWLVFLQTPGNRRRLLLILLTSFFSQCSGNGLVSYYLHDILNSVGITDPNDQSLFNGGLQIWSFLVAICFSVWLVDKAGRKMLFLVAAVGMLIVFSVWTGCSAVYAQTGNKSAGSAVLAMIFLFYGVAGFAWPGLTVAYCSEILPYSIRAKGFAICLGVTALSGVLNQYVNPIGLTELAWKFYFVYIVILVIEVVCIWFLFIKTRGPTLEEIAVLFDGDDAKVCSQTAKETEVAIAEHQDHKA
ncbi:MFS transporter SP family sugar:H+ symporter [Fusarium albosuccineum]|uniref:MFS transporter SP family sugar:H+ symporter n=1 Tax=Fusarium albosuccineum TaxID=1237068 RepID=A0A8H4L123_9HYPO|nr:MFS transporter SP family sugar:H+ symporter [Fusarium albosuccineum]